MEMGFDHGAFMLPTGQERDFAAPAPLDWAGLKARFIAAHSLRRTMSGVASDCLGGSFSGDVAGVLAVARDTSRDVNPNGLANGKALAGKETGIVGTPQTDDRGMT